MDKNRNEKIHVLCNLIMQEEKVFNFIKLMFFLAWINPEYYYCKLIEKEYNKKENSLNPSTLSVRHMTNRNKQ